MVPVETLPLPPYFFMQQQEYIPEVYWSNVAKNIRERNTDPLIAGDDEPYYKYKRKKFLAILKSIDFKNKKVLELGCGPGGNLIEILQKAPAELTGADISEEMLELAKRNLQGKAVQLVKINEARLPFPDDHFDISITATVLQHITDPIQLKEIVSEIARMTRKDIFIFERISHKQIQKISHTGRPVSVYAHAFSSAYFVVAEIKPVPSFWSWMFCGMVRKIFSPKTYSEGRSASHASSRLQSGILKITRYLDRLMPLRGDQAMLHFVKKR